VCYATTDYFVPAGMYNILRILPVRLSVRPLPYVLVTREQKNVEKSKLVQTFPRTRVSGVPKCVVQSHLQVAGRLPKTGISSGPNARILL